MKFLLVVFAFAGLFLPAPRGSAAPVSRQAARPTSGSVAPTASQLSSYETPVITSVRGRVVKVQVPAGYDQVTLERRTVVRARPWVTVATQPCDGTARELTFRLRTALPKRVLRVVAHRMEHLPEHLATGLSEFFASDPGATADDGIARALTLTIDGPALGGGVMTTFAANSAPELGAGTALALSSNGSGSVSSAPASREVVEADIWSLRGDRLYVLNPYRGLQILDVSDPKNPGLLGSLYMPGGGENLYALGHQHAVVISQSFCNFEWNRQPISTSPSSVVVCDVGQGRPVAVASLPIEGTPVESRLVGSALYVTSRVSTQMPYSSRYDYLVSGYDLSNPSAPVSRGSLRIPAPPENTSSYLGAVQSSDSYFMVAQNIHTWDDASGISAYRSRITLIDISAPNGAVKLAGTAQVHGQVKDKFKMQERDGVLTVISDYWLRTGGRTHLENFSLARPTQPRTIGQLDLGHNETLFGTRFDGDRIYVVTFLQIDPLWVIDNSDPAKPLIVSHLEVPGFSTYLHPMGDRLVTIGLLNGRPTVSLFDVADPANPRTLSQLPVSDGWAHSEATSNEKAFSVLPEHGLIMLPVNDGWLSLLGQQEWGGVQLVDLQRDSLALRGRIAHGFSPRRATVHRDAVLALGDGALLSADITDRDQPKVVADLELTWNVDFVWRLGRHLVQIGGSIAQREQVLSVSPRENAEEMLSTFSLGSEEVVAADCRDGYLYLLQRPEVTIQEVDGQLVPSKPLLKLTVYNVASLPAIVKVGETVLEMPSDVSRWNVSILWPLPGTMVVATQQMTYLPWHGTPIFSPEISVDRGAPAFAITMENTFQANLGLSFCIGISLPQKQHLLSVDVTQPAQPQVLAVTEIEPQTTAQFSKLFVAGGKVFMSHHHDWWHFGLVRLKGDVNETPAEIAWEKLRGRHFLNVVDYADPAHPVLRPPVSAPGALRGVARDGSLVYTTGPDYDLHGKPNYAFQKLHASGYDGSKLHLAANYPLPGGVPPLLALGDRVFAFFSKDQPDGTRKNDTHFIEFTDDRGFKLLDQVEFEAYNPRAFGDVVLGDVYTLAGRGISALDFSRPTDLRALGTFHLGTRLTPDLSRADGSREDGFWFPLGYYGVLHVTLPAQP